jgi:hemolysin activation/secretion protein
VNNFYKLYVVLMFVFGVAIFAQSASAENAFEQSPILDEADAADDPQRGLKKKKIPTESIIEQPGIEVPMDDTPVLPDVVPPPASAKHLSVIGSIEVKKIQLSGSKVIPPSVVNQLADRYINKTITIEQLNQLRHELSQYYLQRGYINSGVIIPDQKIENGVVVLKAVEGRLTTININGLKRLNASYVRNRIFAGIHNPLNIEALSASLKLINQDPLIEQINARLLPGKLPGESILDVTVREDDAFYYSAGVDNFVSPSVGAERLWLSAGHGNLLGWGDKLDMDFEYTNGLKGGALSYGVPFTSKGTMFNIFGDYKDYVVVEEPFDSIDIESKSSKYGLSLTHPFIKQLTENMIGGLAFEKKNSKSTLLDQPFSFALGSKDGEVDLSVIDMSMGWVKRFPNRVYSLNGSLRVGILAFGATENEGDLPDGEFTLFKGQGQYAQALPLWYSQFLFRTGFQFTGDTLVAIEKYAVGGRYSVRGYRENQFVRDNGVNASLEWRIPLYTKDGFNKFQMVPFFDYGMSWDTDEELSNTKSQSISSVGLGLLWDPTTHFHMELYWGHALDDVPTPSDKDLQDDGVHFQVTYKSKP